MLYYFSSEQVEGYKFEFKVDAKIIDPAYGGKRVGFFFNIPAARIVDILSSITKRKREELPNFEEAHFIEYDANGYFLEKEIIKNTKYPVAQGVEKVIYVQYKYTRI